MSVRRNSRHRKRRHGGSHFALVPFIDMMTILVVFLLAHTADVDILPNTKNISIPQSLSDRKPSAAVVVMVTKDTVYVDGQPVGTVAQVVANSGPVFAPLKAALDAAERRSPIILLTIDGKPWTEDGFRSSFAKARIKAQIRDVTFNDLRGTAVTRLAIAGATEAEIATITGHALRDVRSILDSHYLNRDPTLGENAIRKLEKGTKVPD